MKRIKNAPLYLLLALAVVFSGCESQVQFSEDEMTLQAKNAVDVLPMSPDFVGMMDVQDMKESRLGARITDNFHAEEFDEVQGLIDATGFNPEEDLKEIYVAIDELGSNGNPGVSVVAYANLDQDRLENYVEERAGDELQSRTYRGVDLYEFSIDEDVGGFSVANDDMILMGSKVELLEGMIDRLIDEGNALSSNGELMELVTSAQVGKSAWFVAEKPDGEMSAGQGGDDMQEAAMQIFTAVDHVVLAMSVDSGELESQFLLQPNASVSTGDLASLVKGFRSAMRSSPDLTDDGLAMLDDIKITSNRDFARIQMKFDEAEIEEMMR